jgi:hypothetical protein
MRRRQAALPFTSARMALSKATICSRSFERAANMGSINGATSGRPTSQSFSPLAVEVLRGRLLSLSHGRGVETVAMMGWAIEV